MSSSSPALHPGKFRETRRQFSYANQQGKFCEVKVKLSHQECPTDVPRGAIHGFSRASRLKVLKLIAKIDWEHCRNVSWISLTYPDEFIHCGYKARTKHRYLFFRYLEKYIGKKVARLWRCEFEPRKSGEHVDSWACHYHIHVFDVPWIPKALIADWWGKALGYKGYVHTRIEALTTAKKAARYAAKYAAKPGVPGGLVNAAYVNTTGRAWGTNRPAWIPMAKERSLPTLDKEQLDIAMKIAGKLKGHEYVGSYFVIGEKALNVFCKIAGRDKKEIDT